MNIGLIGFGTIGRAIAQAIHAGRAGQVELGCVLVRDLNKISSMDVGLVAGRITTSADQFFAASLDVIIEAAGHAAVRQYAERTLRSGRDFLMVSVGAFVDDELLSCVKRAAAQSGRRLMIPSGALGGLDAISSAAIGALKEVTLVVRKPPVAWKGTQAEEAALRAAIEPVCFFEGTAREAAASYPQNVNVAAALSLAGVGLDQTRVRIYADPAVEHNTFELQARGDFGEIKLELKNRPYPGNPKTGHLVVMSLIKAIRRLQDSVVVGF
ncbi:MAG: aspartate dehydrogenase [Acidobacteriota bacterium]|nr:aspartate dehydrogenase [Blastocatellia bacterium]MDW8238320.1 aspartate dehydrogenase [Acidobacteriota bacterium]